MPKIVLTTYSNFFLTYLIYLHYEWILKMILIRYSLDILSIFLHFSTWLVQLILTCLLFPSMNIVDKPDYSKIPLKIQLDGYKHIYTFCTAQISGVTMHRKYLMPLRQAPWTCWQVSWRIPRYTDLDLYRTPRHSEKHSGCAWS